MGVKNLKTDYNSDAVAPDYRCAECGVTGVKLWRLWIIGAWHITCARCTAAPKQIDISGMTPHGQIPGRYIPLTDQLNDRIPAIPTEKGDTWCGYTTVPQAGIAWWCRLPNWPKEPNSADCDCAIATENVGDA